MSVSINVTQATLSNGNWVVSGTLTYPDGTTGSISRTYTGYQYTYFLNLCTDLVIPAKFPSGGATPTAGDVADFIGAILVGELWTGPAPTPPTGTPTPAPELTI